MKRMDPKFANAVASLVEAAIHATVLACRESWEKEAPNPGLEEAQSERLRNIRSCLVLEIHTVFRELSGGLLEEVEALRAKVEQLEDVLQRKAGRLEQELEARVGQLGKDMEQLEKELKSFSEGGSKADSGLEHVLLQDGSLLGEAI